MYYIILLIGVMSFLSLVSWRFPHRAVYAGATPQRRVPADGAPLASGGKVVEPALSDEAITERVANALRGEWTEERPCLTPIDCVLDHKCDGHCGRH